MRIWSVHPKYLDRLGLLACWRETLLAQKVLQGQTKGYRHHPQLLRFRSSPAPLAAVASYLESLADEGSRRGYSFNREKIPDVRLDEKIKVSRGQVLYEWQHLKVKFSLRDPHWLSQFSTISLPDPHPIFDVVDGNVEFWEKVS